MENVEPVLQEPVQPSFFEDLSNWLNESPMENVEPVLQEEQAHQEFQLNPVPVQNQNPLTNNSIQNLQTQFGNPVQILTGFTNLDNQGNPNFVPNLTGVTNNQPNLDHQGNPNFVPNLTGVTNNQPNNQENPNFVPNLTGVTNNQPNLDNEIGNWVPNLPQENVNVLAEADPNRRYITVMLGEITKTISIPVGASYQSIVDCMRGAFGVCGSKLFHIVDSQGIPCAIDNGLSPGKYFICLDKGVEIGVIDQNNVVEVKRFFTEEHFSKFMRRKHIKCLQLLLAGGVIQEVDSIGELQNGRYYYVVM